MPAAPPPARWPRLLAAGLLTLWCLATPLPTLSAQQPGEASSSSSAADPPPPPAAVPERKSALDVYRDGGWFMHVLLLCSVGTIAVVVYCFVQLTPKKMAPKPLVDRINACMAAKDVGTAYQLCQAGPNPFANVIATALLKVNFDRDLSNKASMVEAAAESLDGEEHRQMVWVNYLNVFATLAPMIGLLGTVWGMIESFDQLASGKTEPQDLAGGIQKAMITTAGGLLVGIPAMFFYFLFRDRLQGLITSIQKHASFAIDILSGEIRLEGSAPESGSGSGSGPEVEAEADTGSPAA